MRKHLAALLITITTLQCGPQPATAQPAVVDWHGIADILDYLELAHGDGIRGLITNYFPEEAAYALDVAWCESRHRNDVIGGAGERGPLQIHPVHSQPGELLDQIGLTWDDMHDPRRAVRAAKALRDRDGWGPWTCARSGAGGGGPGTCTGLGGCG